MKAGWQTKTLGELAVVFADGDWVESKDQSTEGVRLIQTGNVGEGIFKDRGNKARYISEATFKRLRCTEIFEGDCLISRLPDPVGRSCLLPDTGERMITAVDCTIVRFDAKLVMPTFFNYYTQSTDYLDAVNAETSGTTRNRISRANLGRIAVPVPLRTEQQRIVGILDEVFDSIATAKSNAEQNLQNARALFESHLQSVFTQRGEGWETKTLGDIAEVKGGKRVPKGYKLLAEPTAYPYLRVADFTDDGSIDMSDLRYVSTEVHRQIKNYIIYSTDLYLSIAGTIGKTGIIPKELDGANLTENACRLVFKPGISNRFVYYFTQTASFVDQAGVHTRTAAQPKLALSRLSTINLGVPSFSEQERLASEFDALREETQRLESLYQRKLAALDELKKSLLHQAFSGQL